MEEYYTENLIKKIRDLEISQISIMEGVYEDILGIFGENWTNKYRSVISKMRELIWNRNNEAIYL